MGQSVGVRQLTLETVWDWNKAVLYVALCALYAIFLFCPHTVCILNSKLRGLALPSPLTPDPDPLPFRQLPSTQFKVSNL